MFKNASKVITLQAHLGVEGSEEVEDWLVRAMGKKLLSGQMDQVKQQVTITKSSMQTFGAEDWQTLERQLAAWKASPSFPNYQHALLVCFSVPPLICNHGILAAASVLLSYI